MVPAMSKLHFPLLRTRREKTMKKNKTNIYGDVDSDTDTDTGRDKTYHCNAL